MSDVEPKKKRAIAAKDASKQNVNNDMQFDNKSGDDSVSSTIMYKSVDVDKE